MMCFRHTDIVASESEPIVNYSRMIGIAIGSAFSTHHHSSQGFRVGTAFHLWTWLWHLFPKMLRRMTIESRTLNIPTIEGREDGIKRLFIYLHVLFMTLNSAK